MMSFLAVSVALAMGSSQMNQVGQNTLTDGLLMLGGIQNPSGVAVQIRRDGLFLASSNLIPSETSSARGADGKDYTVRVITRDDITQLSLIRVVDWKEGAGRVYKVASENDVTTQKLVAWLPSGKVAGQLVSTDRTGILQSSRRYVRLWEVRFESTAQKLGGAPVFTFDGRLAGMMNATLEPYSNQDRNELTTQKIYLGPQHFGPQGMTVGYALGPKVLNRVVKGFLNDDHTPLHPTVGILFKLAEGGGVEITSVTPGSAAARAGLQVGDVLLKLGTGPVKDAFWLAARLFESEIGEPLQFLMRRNGQLSSVKVIVESLSEARSNRDTPPNKPEGGAKTPELDQQSSTQPSRGCSTY